MRGIDATGEAPSVCVGVVRSSRPYSSGILADAGRKSSCLAISSCSGNVYDREGDGDVGGVRACVPTSVLV